MYNVKAYVLLKKQDWERRFCLKAAGYMKSLTEVNEDMKFQENNRNEMMIRICKILQEDEEHFGWLNI